MEKINSEEDKCKIEEATRDQYLCDQWFAERKTRLTSSRFGLIRKRKKAVTKRFCLKLVEGRDLRKVPAVAYGLAHEALALERFRVQMGFEVIRKAGFLYVMDCLSLVPRLMVLYLRVMRLRLNSYTSRLVRTPCCCFLLDIILSYN